MNVVDVDSKYLDFLTLATPRGRKTAIVRVTSKESGAHLGQISFYSPWRQYVFYPCDACLFHAGCLSDIITALGQLNGDHRDQLDHARRARRLASRAAAARA